MKIFVLFVLFVVVVFVVFVQVVMLVKFVFKVIMLDGKFYDFVVQCGYWVVVNYWVMWCVLCIKEMLDIFVFVSGCKDVSVIGLVYDDSDIVDICVFVVKYLVSYLIVQVMLDNLLKDFDELCGLFIIYLIVLDGMVVKCFVGLIFGEVLKVVIDDVK